MDTVKEFTQGKPLTLADPDAIPYAEARAAAYIIGERDNWRGAS